jgi:hypothetical protein
VCVNAQKLFRGQKSVNHEHISQICVCDSQTQKEFWVQV